jgi:hypothetical protein
MGPLTRKVDRHSAANPRFSAWTRVGRGNDYNAGRGVSGWENTRKQMWMNASLE